MLLPGVFKCYSVSYSRGASRVRSRTLRRSNTICALAETSSTTLKAL
jgi:hypothetical protein